MKLFLILTAICLSLFLLDRLGLWLENRGLLYYRKKKSPGGFIGNALLEVQSLFNSGAHNVIEMKQSNVKFVKNESKNSDDI